jgi:hypothetical protein
VKLRKLSLGEHFALLGEVLGTEPRDWAPHLVDAPALRGSTNWSLAGEQKQDNELTVSGNAVLAAETRAALDRNHDWMLKQMAAAAAEKKTPATR